MGLSTLKFQYERNFLEAWEDYETGILPYVTAGYKAIAVGLVNRETRPDTRLPQSRAGGQEP